MSKKSITAETTLINRQIDELFRLMEEDYYFQKNLKDYNIKIYNSKLIKKDSYLCTRLKKFYKIYSFFHLFFFSLFSLLFIVFIIIVMGEIYGIENIDTMPNLIKTSFTIFVLVCFFLSIIFSIMAYMKIWSELYGDAYIYELQAISKRIKSIGLTESSSFFEFYDQMLFKSIYKIRMISLRTCISYFELNVSIMKESQKAYEKMSFIFAVTLIILIYMFYGKFLDIKKINDVIKFYPLLVLINSILQGLSHWFYHKRIKSLQQSLFLLNNLQSINSYLNV